MLDDEIVGLLRAIYESLDSDKYESGGYYTIGGGPGVYVLKTPFNTECEFQIAAITTTSAASVGYIITSANPAMQAPIKNSTVYGALISGSEGNALNANAGFITNTAPATFIEWEPMGRGENLYLISGVAGTDTLLATIAFRRSFKRLIPSAPRPKPHTHVIQSRRNLRTQPAAEAEMAAGFQSQYPTEGRMYKHEPPESEDTGNIGNIARRIWNNRGR